MSAQFPASLEKLIQAFARLPGIGERTAQRLAFHLVRSPEQISCELGEAALNLKKELQFCAICRNVADSATCAVCADLRRDHSQICVVAESLDALALEQAGAFRGVYHVLHGVLSPLDGIGPEQLTIADLLKRVENEKPAELVLALSPSTEGEATAAYLTRQLQSYNLKISRLARGLPTGSELSYADSVTLSAAFENRQNY